MNDFDSILIVELMDALEARVPSLHQLPLAFWRRSAALNTWGTNAIEGNTLTRSDVERLLLEGDTPGGRSSTDVIETLQHEEAFRGLLSRKAAPPDLVAVLELHEQVFRGIPRYSPGMWRRINVYIAGSRHRPPRHEKVIREMERWLEAWHVRLDTGSDVFVSAAWMHQTFEEIHPFVDGNGRVGRLLLNLHFLINGWPPVHILPIDRAGYLRALQAGGAGDANALQSFLVVRMCRSLLDILDQVGGAEDALRPLAAFRDEPWNPYEANYLGLRARSGTLPAIPLGATSSPPLRVPGGNGTKWLTSERALKAYVRLLGRQEAWERLPAAGRAALLADEGGTGPLANG